MKLLRKRRGLTQTALAEHLELSRTTLIGYEKGVQPPFPTLIKISEYFKVSLDALIRYDLSALSEFQLSEIDRGMEVDITGRQLRLLTISTDKKGKENIEMVSQKAQAGYTAGYGDPEFIAELPKFNLPFLDQNKSYRCFQIAGDSMLPIPEGAWVTASYVQDWRTVVSGHAYILVTKEDGVVFKLVYPKKGDDKTWILVSTNRIYKPYEIKIEELRELWKFETYHSHDF
ncbi:XRE family transcriptional regulator [Luteibaculum oceani]|uniref:XRE family transcriptional regulator n=1 Tax=Luteibaculum oceani TaxID=1294296 RepID=UPI0021D06FC7|nr:LexA family transcriptional regulator [Luteibaculum oceani]